MKRRIFAVFTAFITIINFTAVCFGADIQSVDYSKRTKTELTRDGAVYTLYEGSYDKNGDSYKQIAHSVSAKLGMKTKIEVVGGNYVYGRSTLSSKLSGYDAGEDGRVIAAINGDFFSGATGIPLGLQIENGILKTTNNSDYDKSQHRYSIGFKADGSAVVDIPQIKINVTVKDIMLNPQRLNNYPAANFVILSSDYSYRSYWSEIAHDVLVIKAEGDLKLGSKLVGTFEEYLTDVKDPIVLQKGYYYLIEPSKTEKKYLPAAAKDKVKGDEATIEIKEKSGQWDDVETALSGGNLLVKDGKVVNPSVYDKDISKKMTSRSALGIKKDGSVVFFASERDNKGEYSAGIYMDALAKALEDIGCETAINLDGGGSTSFALAGENKPATMINAPQDGSERAVSNCILLVHTEAKPVILEDFEKNQPKQTEEQTEEHQIPVPDYIDVFDGQNLITAKPAQENVYTGQQSLMLDYKLSGEGSVSVEFSKPVNVFDYSYLSVAVKSDGSGNVLEAVYNSAYGKLKQEICKLDFDGYKHINFESDVASELIGFSIRNETNEAKAGVIYLDRIVGSKDFPLVDFTAPVIDSTYSKDVYNATVTDGANGTDVDGEGAEITVNGQTAEHSYKDGVIQVNMKDIPKNAVSLGVTEVCDTVGNRTREISLFTYSNDKTEMPFEDTKKGTWDSNYIRYCFENEFISGIPEQNKLMFKGAHNITRTEFCVMLVSRAGLDEKLYSGVKLPYSDVDSIPKWAILYVKAAYAEKIMVGTGDAFNPFANITRAEAASAACGIAKVDDRLMLEKEYADKNLIPDWAKQTVEVATTQRIFDGNEKGEFNPLGLLTRSESAVIMTQILI